MLHANELRIGNCYHLLEENVDIDDIYQISDGDSLSDIWRYNNALPVELKENAQFELSDRHFNFIGFGTRLIYQDILYPTIKIEILKKQWAFYFKDELISFKDYLHEAQNFYFALTTKELPFKYK